MLAGEGIFKYANGDVYEGQFNNGMFNDEGSLRYPGEFIEMKPIMQIENILSAARSNISLSNNELDRPQLVKKEEKKKTLIFEKFESASLNNR